MTQPNHPSAERISDLLAGSLPAAEAMQVNAHLAGCAECRDVRQSLLDVTALLADVGASTEEMPSDITASLDSALARAGTERATGGRHVDTESIRRPAPNRPAKWLLGAAAAVVIATAGVAGINALPSQDSDSSASGGSGDGLAPVTNQRGDYAVPSAVPSGGDAGGDDNTGKSSPKSYLLHPLTADKVPAAARSLAGAPREQSSPPDQRCAPPLVGDRSTVVLFEGRRAVLSITQGTRTAVILDCMTATRSLLVTGY